MGILIWIIIATYQTNNASYIIFTFWENMGRYTLPVMIPTLALNITLMISLKGVKRNDNNKETFNGSVNIHNAQVGKSIDCEMQYTPEKIITRDALINQDPIRCEDDDYESMRPVKWTNSNNVNNTLDKDNSSNDNQSTETNNLMNTKRHITKWHIIATIIVGLFLVYGIVASTVNSTIATCNNDNMMYTYCLIQKYYWNHYMGDNISHNEYRSIRCDYSTFKKRMISNKLYRKKIYNSLMEDTKKLYKDFDSFQSEFDISHNLRTPLIWLW